MNWPQTKLLSQVEMRIGAADLAHHPSARNHSGKAIMIGRFYILKMDNIRFDLIKLARNNL